MLKKSNKTTYNKDFLREMLSLFSAHQIAAMCLVDLKTAQRWKSGRQKPRAAHLELIKLHAEGRIVPEAWPLRIEEHAQIVDLYDGAYRLRLVDLINYWINLQQFGWVQRKKRAPLHLIEDARLAAREAQGKIPRDSTNTDTPSASSNTAARTGSVSAGSP